jgi:hypothetical protein
VLGGHILGGVVRNALRSTLDEHAIDSKNYPIVVLQFPRPALEDSISAEGTGDVRRVSVNEKSSSARPCRSFQLELYFSNVRYTAPIDGIVLGRYSRDQRAAWEYGDRAI